RASASRTRTGNGSGTTTAPATHAPHAHVIHAGSFGPRTPTASPGATPRRSRAPAQRRASSHRSAAVSGTMRSARWNVTPGSPRDAAARSSSASVVSTASTLPRGPAPSVAPPARGSATGELAARERALDGGALELAVGGAGKGA